MSSNSKHDNGDGANGARRTERDAGKDFLVVGIGASAGGVQALKQIFAQVPAASGMTSVVILHLSPDHDSKLAEILQTAARIPVTQVTERVQVEPDHIYVVPPNQHLTYEVQAEELKASNEELQAINEELRSATEELKTSREELQSVNEELVTLNQELKIKIEELSLSNADIQNLIASTNIGTIFLDRALRIKMFTPAARDVFNLIAADAGRPLSDITHRLEYKDLIRDAETVLEKLQTIEREVRVNDGRTFLMQVSPYRTTEDRINGVVLTFVNITRRKQVEEALGEVAQSLEQQSRIFDTTLSSITDFAYTFDEEGRFVYSNQALLDLLGITLEEIVGKNFAELNYPDDLAARLQSQIQQVFDTGETVKDETPFTSPIGMSGYYEYIFNPVAAADGSVEFVAGSTRDVTERKAAEESARFQAHLLDTVEQSVIATDLDAKVIFWNQFAERLYGWTAEEAMGRSIMELTTPDMMAEQATEIMSLLRQGKSWTGEFQVRRRDATTFPAQVFNSPIQDSQGSLVGIVGVSGDITERKRAEEKLRRSEAELRLITDSIPSLISYVDKTEHYRFVNAVYEEWFKQPREQIIGRTLEDVLGAAYPPVKDCVRRALAGETVIFENKLDYPQEQRFVLAQYVPDTDASGEVQGFYAHVTDIGESKRAEERLRESEERFRAMFEQANVGIVQTTIDGQLLKANPGFCKFIGYTQDETRGLTTRDVTHRDDCEAEAELTRRLIAREISGYTIEKRYVRKDGSIIWGQMTATLVRHATGEPFYTLLIVEDISDRKVAQEDLLRAHEELENRVRERTHELADTNASLKAEVVERKTSEAARVRLLHQLVSAQEDERRRIARDLHDHLGQQLTALRLKIAALKEECGKDKKLCAQAEEAQTLAAQLDSDVDFLAWELRPAALDDLGLTMALHNYVREWSGHFNTPAEFHASNLEAARLAPEIETNLYRIAQEALNNIYKYAGASRVEVLLERRDHHVVLIVEDDGIGFDLHKKENTDPTVKGNGDRGLGLMGMRERAALVGGTLQIESDIGAGTTIFARIPVSLAVD